MGNKIFNTLNGKFGRRVLKQPYRNIYRSIVWSLIILAIWEWIMCPFFSWWNGVVYMLNNVIWG